MKFSIATLTLMAALMLAATAGAQQAPGVPPQCGQGMFAATKCATNPSLPTPPPAPTQPVYTPPVPAPVAPPVTHMNIAPPVREDVQPSQPTYTPSAPPVVHQYQPSTPQCYSCLGTETRSVVNKIKAHHAATKAAKEAKRNYQK
jgi:hypothetical protein